MAFSLTWGVGCPQVREKKRIIERRHFEFYFLSYNLYIKLFCNKAIVPPATKASITLNINLSFLGNKSKEMLKENLKLELSMQDLKLR